MLCMEETDFSWKQSLTASLTEQQLSFASEEFILHQVLQCHCQAQQGHCWSSNAVNSDLIRVGLRPPSPFAQVTDQHSFILSGMKSALKIPPSNQPGITFAASERINFAPSLWSNTEPKNFLEPIVSDLCADSELYKRNMFSCILSFPSLLEAFA